MTTTDESRDWIERARNYLEYQVNLGFREVMLLEKPGTIISDTSLEAVRSELGEMTWCPLHKARRNIVFGEGNPHARLMFVGEGPGADEDRQGRPFVGRAGQLLTRMIQAMGLDRADVYIANIVKCRPPENRDPQPLEIRTCFPFLERQINSVAPEVIVALGRVAACTILGIKDSMTNLRGERHALALASATMHDEHF